MSAHAWAARAAIAMACIPKRDPKFVRLSEVREQAASGLEPYITDKRLIEDILTLRAHDPRPMTVRELRARLTQLDDDLPVAIPWVAKSPDKAVTDAVQIKIITVNADGEPVASDEFCADAHPVAYILGSES